MYCFIFLGMIPCVMTAVFWLTRSLVALYIACRIPAYYVAPPLRSCRSPSLLCSIHRVRPSLDDFFCPTNLWVLTSRATRVGEDQRGRHHRGYDALDLWQPSVHLACLLAARWQNNEQWNAWSHVARHAPIDDRGMLTISKARSFAQVSSAGI